MILSDLKIVVFLSLPYWIKLTILEESFKNHFLRHYGPVAIGFLWSYPTYSSGATTHMCQSLTQAGMPHTHTYITYLLFQIFLTSLNNRYHHS